MTRRRTEDLHATRARLRAVSAAHAADPARADELYARMIERAARALGLRAPR